jgi:hypothetical protein
VSDRIGREVTMAFAFALEGAAILLWIQFAHVPTLFVPFGPGVLRLGRGVQPVPAAAGDTFGPRYATVNYSLLYTAKERRAARASAATSRRDGKWWPGFTGRSASTDGRQGAVRCALRARPSPPRRRRRSRRTA